MVMTVLSRRSSRPSRASCGTSWGTDRACSSTSGGKSRRMPRPYRMAATALSRLRAGPKSSRRVPIGGVSPPPKLVMETAPRWPAAPAGRRVSARMRGSLSLSGRSHSSLPCRSSTPVTVRLARSTTRRTRATLRPSSRSSRAGTAATLSPSQALPWALGGTNQSSCRPRPPSGLKKPNPRLVAW